MAFGEDNVFGMNPRDRVIQPEIKDINGGGYAVAISFLLCHTY